MKLHESGPSVERKLELYLVAQRDAIDPEQWQLRLQRLSRTRDRVPVKCGQDEPAPLVEAQRGHVVIAGQQPKSCGAGLKSATHATREEGRARALSLRKCRERNHLGFVVA